MKKIYVGLLVLALLIICCPAGLASADNAVLVAYFSRSGNTREMALEIARQTGGDVFRIVPARPYPDDYQQTLDRATREMNEDARPEFVGDVENIASYDTILVGYPIWWGDMPCVVRTFLTRYDMSGKTVIPFPTTPTRIANDGCASSAK